MGPTESSKKEHGEVQRGLSAHLQTPHEILVATQCARAHHSGCGHRRAPLAPNTRYAHRPETHGSIGSAARHEHEAALVITNSIIALHRNWLPFAAFVRRKTRTRAASTALSDLCAPHAKHLPPVPPQQQRRRRQRHRRGRGLALLAGAAAADYTERTSVRAHGMLRPNHEGSHRYCAVVCARQLRQDRTTTGTKQTNKPMQSVRGDDG